MKKIQIKEKQTEILHTEKRKSLCNNVWTHIIRLTTAYDVIVMDRVTAIRRCGTFVGIEDQVIERAFVNKPHRSGEKILLFNRRTHILRSPSESEWSSAFQATRKMAGEIRCTAMSHFKAGHTADRLSAKLTWKMTGKQWHLSGVCVRARSFVFVIALECARRQANANRSHNAKSKTADIQSKSSDAEPYTIGIFDGNSADLMSLRRWYSWNVN